MNWFVYIIYSESKDVFYKGVSEHPYERLLAHNENKSQYTSHKGPWKLVHLEICPTKKDALIREKMLKRQNRDYIKWILEQPISTLKNVSPVTV